MYRFLPRCCDQADGVLGVTALPMLTASIKQKYADL